MKENPYKIELRKMLDKFQFDAVNNCVEEIDYEMSLDRYTYDIWEFIIKNFGRGY